MANGGRQVSRRAVLAAGAAGGAAGLASALRLGGSEGSVYGGIMALDEAYNVSGDLWIGPDSAKKNVDADSGCVYIASDTQVEYYGDDGRWVKMGVGSQSEPVPAVNTEQLYTDPLVMYVDPNGDDANDGLSSSTPKQTFAAALEDAPLHGDQSTQLTIRAAAGTYTPRGAENNVVNLEASALARIKIVGKTDSNNDPTVTLDATGVNSAVRTVNCYVVLEDITVKGGGSTLNSPFQGGLDCRNVHARAASGTSQLVYAQMTSVLEMDSECDFDVTAASDPNFNIAITGCSVGRISGLVKGGDGDSNGVIQGKETVWVFLKKDTIVDGDGMNQWLVQIRDNSDLKINGNVTFKNGLGRAKAQNNSNLKYHGPITDSNMSATHSVGDECAILDENDNKYVGRGANAVDPSLNGARFQGSHHYNASDDLAKYFSHDRSAWIPYGATEYAAPTASDLANRERAFDTTNNRWLYKDSSGTVHYWTADGTL